MLTDGRTDDGRKVITIAHPEQSSGELIIGVLLMILFLHLLLLLLFFFLFLSKSSISHF